MEYCKRPKIGIFDSGVGGISVFHHAVRTFPHMNIAYLADTARYPYGEKTEEQIHDYIREILLFFREKNCDAVIIACSTASGIFLKHSGLSLHFNGPVVTMLNKCLCQAVDRLSLNRKIGILATRLTEKANQFSAYIKSHLPDIDVFCHAAPDLVELVTQGKTEGQNTFQKAGEYLSPLFEQGIDTLVIGCTHFHFITSILESLCRENRSIIAPAPLSITYLKRILPIEKMPAGEKRTITFFVTGDVKDFIRQATETASLDYPAKFYQKISLTNDSQIFTVTRTS